MEFFSAGAVYDERVMMAANRIGKTLGVGGYEVVTHLTGDYPEWWDGKRFDRAIRAWAAGNTRATTRDIIQKTLCGPVNDLGTGLIPKHLIAADPKRQSGVQDAFESISVRHVSGGISIVQFKSYDQGRKAFEGTEREIIWCDEEPPKDIWGECRMRTMTTNGHVLGTFTPLDGMSELCMDFLPELAAA